MDYLISVIVPAYNTAPWLPRCLDSILAQTYRNLEVIVVDDGSTDGTPQILDEYAGKDPRILAVHQKNAGAVAAREKGVDLASGAYIAFADSDDAVEPQMYQRLLENALKYNADISHCGMCFCFPDGREEPHYGTGRLKLQDHLEGMKDLLSGYSIEPSLCNKLYRSSLLPDSCLDETIAYNEDFLKNFVLFDRAQKSVYEDFCGYRYFQRKGFLSKDPKSRVLAQRHTNRSRKLAMEHASEAVYPYALRSWLMSALIAVGKLAGDRDPEAVAYREECRELLRKERKNFHFLNAVQRLGAQMLLLAPGLYQRLYQVLYRAYRLVRIRG